ncbi:MAG: alpha-glucosidase [Chloroflexota bacterium]
MTTDNYLWWQEGAIYHIYLRSFADSDGDGLGDIPGLIAHLDHLNGTPESLGVDAIWLSPCFPSPDRDFGYDVADYRTIDPHYGTMDDFDRLVEQAHRRGIRVLLDLVFNHTSDQHPWFLESRSSPQSPRRDWYLWHDPRPGRRPPNNWQSVFGGRGWEWDETRQQFYFHLFLKEQPDLNWRNPVVRQELMDTVRFWLDRGVDGFRLDVFSAWFKHADMPDNPPRFGLRGFDRQHHLYDVNQPEMFGALAELRGILDSYPERAAVGEPFGSSLSQIASYCGQDKLHLVFNFAFSHCRWQPAQFLRVIQEWDAAVPADGWPCYVLSNHDLSRHVSRYGGQHPDAVSKVAAALLLTQRGTPFIYYGEEIGMRDIPIRRSQILDPPGRRYWPFYKGRDPARSPMQWDDSPNAGFTRGRPWLPVHPDYTKRNVAAQRENPRSVFSFYQALLRLRRTSIALRRGSFRTLTTRPRQGLAYLREAPGKMALVALNFTPAPARLGLDVKPPQAQWELRLSSLTPPWAAVRGREIRLGPHEAAVFFAT